MPYAFPVASHIDAYLAAIADAPEFIVKRDAVNGLLTINYLFVTATTFPDPLACSEPAAARNAALRRDCRGIEFAIETGDVVTKKYHKFFSANELPESQVHRIDWTKPHHILDKLDGSLLTPWHRPDGSWQWHTKMGDTEVAQPVNRFVAASEVPYARFCAMMAEDGKTPLFEWCSRSQRIVIDYPIDGLILTAIRDIITGQYTPYPEMRLLAKLYDIPCVGAVPGNADTIQALVDETRAATGIEGYVIRFMDGHAYKVKGTWYQHIHGIKEMLSSEKRVWALLLDNRCDDVAPFMDPVDRAAMEQFQQDFAQAIFVTAQRLTQFVTAGRYQTQDDKKRFAVDIILPAACPPAEKALLFAIWDGKSGVAAVRDFLRGHTATQTRLDTARALVGGLTWSRYHAAAADE